MPALVPYLVTSFPISVPLLRHKHTVMGRLIKDMVHWWSMIFKVFRAFEDLHAFYRVER